jgi:hypothetical protein
MRTISKSITFVPVGPVISNSPVSLKKLYESFLSRYSRASSPF